MDESLLWGIGGLAVVLVLTAMFHEGRRRMILDRVTRLEVQYKAIEDQLQSVRDGNDEILRRQDPLVQMANQLAGALVQVSVPGRRGKAPATTQIRIEAPDARVQTGGSSFGDRTQVQGPVAGRDVTKEPPP